MIDSWFDEPVQIRRLFRIVNGGTPTSQEENWNGDVIWVTPEDLGSNPRREIGSSRRTLTQAGLCSAASLVPAGSVVVSTRAPIGHLAIADTELAFNQGCKALVPVREVDARYFYYQLLARRGNLQAAGRGSTFVELSGEGLGAFPVLDPPLEKQRRIGDFLEFETARIDALRATKQRLATRLQERLERLAEGLVAGAGRLVRLKFLLERVEQGWSPEAESREALPGETAILKLSAVSGAGFRPVEHKAIESDALPPDWPRYQVEPGDLLFTRASGSRRLVAKPCLVEGDLPWTLLFPDLMYRLVPRSSALSHAYLWTALNARSVRARLLEQVRGVANNKVRIEDVRETQVPLPGLVDQEEIANRFHVASQRTREVLRRIEISQLHLSERRQALITAAVTGQIDPSSYRRPAELEAA